MTKHRRKLKSGVGKTKDRGPTGIPTRTGNQEEKGIGTTSIDVRNVPKRVVEVKVRTTTFNTTTTTDHNNDNNNLSCNSLLPSLVLSKSSSHYISPTHSNTFP